MPHSINRRCSPCFSFGYQVMGSYGRMAFSCGLLALVATAGGCQRRPTWDLAPVEGTITKDGRPLPHIRVFFVADLDAGTQGPQTSAITDKAGHYRLRTDNGDDGVVVGKHRVLILDLETALMQKGQTARGAEQKVLTRLPPETVERIKDRRKSTAETPRVPPSYGRFNETPLRVEVQPGPQNLDFDIP